MKAIKDEFIQIRLTSKQKESIRNSAKKANTDMSSWILSKIAYNQSLVFSNIVKKLSVQQDQSYVYAEIHDLLMKCDSSSFSLTVDTISHELLSCFQINYIAAMVEHRAKQLCEPVPRWCAQTPSMDAPYFGTRLKSLSLHLLLNSPLAFRRRNIFIDSTVGERI